MSKQTSIFGWKSVFRKYGWKGFLLDSILPVVISALLSVIMYCKDVDTFLQLKHLLSIGISIIPSMVALILTAYTIILTFIIGDKFASIKNTKKGKELIQDLNSSFAACIFVSTISIVAMIVISSIANIGIIINDPNVVNYPTYFIICYLLVYSVSVLIGIVIDIFNCGQTILLEENDETNQK